MELTPGRFGRRLLALLVVAALSGACTGEGSGTASENRSAHHDAQVAVGAAKACADAGRYGSMCRFVTVDGRPYRYAIVPGDGTSSGLTVLDPGGPGSSLFGRGWPTEALRRLKGTDVLLLEEPWVIATYPDACRTSLTAWYRAAASPDPGASAAQRVAARCDLFAGRWGWDAATYGEVLGAIIAQEHRTPDRFVGFSFGSARLGYIERAGLRLPRVDLYSPFPVGAAASDWLRARQADLARGPLFSDAVVGQTPPGRSIPISQADVAAARIEAQYLTAATRRSLATRPGDAATVGRLSDMLYGRYGVDDLSPALLAYWDETCVALTGWAGVGAATPLERFNGPCAAAPASTPTAPGGGTTRTCVAGSLDDGVVPAGVLRRWSLARGWRPRMGHGRHADIRLMTRCGAG